MLDPVSRRKRLKAARDRRYRERYDAGTVSVQIDVSPRVVSWLVRARQIDLAELRYAEERGDRRAYRALLRRAIEAMHEASARV